MLKLTSFTGALALVALPTLMLVPGCGGGNDGVVFPTSTPTVTATAIATTTATRTPNPTATQPTSAPTATSRPTPIATSVSATPFARLTFTAQNGGNFGSGAYSAADISPDDSSTPTRIQVYTSGNVNRFFGVILRTSAPLADGQRLALGGKGSYIFTSAPPQSSSSTASYDNYGGEGIGTGTLQVQRTGNVVTLSFTNIVLPHDNAGSGGPAPSNSTITVTGSIRFTLPANAR